MEEKQKLEAGEAFREVIALDSAIGYEAGGPDVCSETFYTTEHGMGGSSTWDFLYASVQEYPWKKNKS